MADRFLKKAVLAVCVIAAAFSGIVALTGPLERARPQLSASYGDTDLSMNGSRLKGFALGMEGLLADWYWIRALQYMGDKMIKNKDQKIDYDDLRSINPHLLLPLLENATDLDPHFIGAYSYGAIVMPAVDKDAAIRFAQKGIVNNPNEWRLYQHLGYIYWRLGDYEKAAETYEKGSKIPGSSSFMSLMVGSMRLEGGTRTTARTIYRQMLAESDDEAVRITAERHLIELDWLDQRDAMRAVLKNVQEKNGKCVDRLSEIIPMLLQVQLPDGGDFQTDKSNNLVDPSGAPYLLDREKCDVVLDQGKTKVPSQ
ncbi:MAG: hypothetical protein QM785_15935 [Pyrinomonadaceae bacterium]